MKISPLILQIAVPTPLYRYFDYLAPASYTNKQLIPGLRVRISFGKREVIGFLINTKTDSDIPASQLKPVLEILDSKPLLPSKLFELLLWASDYYHYPLGEVFAAALPSLLRKGFPATERKRGKVNFLKISNSHDTNSLNLNLHQQHAVDSVIQSLEHFQTFLLDGVTGSGKTEVYLQIIASVLKQNKQALILVPEIGLTPQTLARFQQRFAVPITAIHSNLTDRERLDAWLYAEAGTAQIIIGTRSAIFTPFAKLGIIIIDEEHDISFKQQDSFRYCARDLAIVRGRLEQVPVLLGSATPSLESLHNVQRKRYQYLHLPERAGSSIHPTFHLLDIRNQKLDNGLSNVLLKAIQQHVTQGGQVLLFLNRRGFAPVFICHHCGWVANCKRCDANMTLHKNPPYLQCHHCGSTRDVETQCPDCQNTQLFPLGLGTQRLEKTLAELFPNINIARIDRDSTRTKNKLHDMLDNIHSGNYKILIGTQMLAKGHHFPDVSLVAILDADSGLFSADFRATERIAQLLIQVAGRAGRAERPGEVLIQTHHPNHPLLQQLITEGYNSFTNLALHERKTANLPPYNYLTLIRAEALKKELPLNFLIQVKALAEKLSNKKITILGPVPALMPRRAGFSRAQLLLQSSQRKPLHELLKKLVIAVSELPNARRVRWSVDIDPREMA